MVVHPEISLFCIPLGIQMHFANEYMKDDISELQRKI